MKVWLVHISFYIYGRAKEWWRNFVRTSLIGSHIKEWDVFYSSFILPHLECSLHHALLDCYATTMTLAISIISRVERVGATSYYPRKVISFIWDYTVINKLYLCYLGFIQDTTSYPPPIGSMHMVWEVVYVLPTDISYVSLDRDINFSIDFDWSSRLSLCFLIISFLFNVINRIINCRICWVR